MISRLSDFGRMTARPALALALLVAMLLAAACTVVPYDPSMDMEMEEEPGTLIVYSGRNENLVGPLLDQFAEETGIEVRVRYGNTAGLAATILEEGENSPADVYYGQDAGALGALSRAGRFATLPDDVVAQVNSDFVSSDGTWIGTSLRARVLVYNTEELTADDLPDDIWGLTEEKWRGRVGWAPTNGSFQAFVTGLRVLQGEERAKAWLEAMMANDVQVHPKNTPIVAATGAGELSVGLVNHYYLLRFKAEDPDFPAANFHFRSAGPGAMVNVAGVGIVNSCANCDEAEQFVRFLISNEAQSYFIESTHEYPVTAEEFMLKSAVVPLADFDTPDLNLNDLETLDETLNLLREVGALE